MNHKLTAIFLLLFIMGACAPKPVVKPEAEIPQPELKLPEVEIKNEPEPLIKPEPPAVEKKAEEQYIMLNFENADLETVITTVGEMLKINYIISPGVTGKITIQSHNKIPISELFSTFQTILEFNGFTAVKYGSFYRIVPIDTAKQQPLKIEAGKSQFAQKDDGFITQEIPLEYVKANDVANIVRNLMPKGTDIVVYEPQNMLIVTAAPAGIVKFLKLLEAIDIPSSDRDSVRTFVYYVENGEAKKLGDILKSIYAKKGTGATTTPVRTASPVAAPSPTSAPGARPSPARPQAAGASVQEGLTSEIEGEVGIDVYEDVNAIIIKTTPRGYLTLLETLKKLDVQARQVLIEVLIAEITLDDTTQFGIEWLVNAKVQVNNENLNVVGGFTGANTAHLNFDTALGDFVFPTTSGTTTGSTILSHPPNVFANIIDPTKFQALITAAATTGKLNVISSPHILALDNKEAKIEVADEVPVATSITTPAAGAYNTATSQVQFKSAGIIMTVTPHINEKKQVSLKLVQEASQLGKVYPIGGQDFQGFTTRKATTTAIVQDGHTLVIGGIINEAKGTSRSGLPFLSDIPLFGYLFGATTDTLSKRELIIMVTPHVIANVDEADELSSELKNRVRGVKEKIESREKNLKANIKKGKEKEQEEKEKAGMY